MEMKSRNARVNNLVLKASKGDHQAFGDLYELFLDQIYRYVFFRVGNQQDAEDLTENCFVKAWQALMKNPDQPIRNFNAWIYRIANNTITDHFRKKRPVLMAEITQLKENTAEEPEDILIQDDVFDELVSAMETLDERSYQVIQLRFLSQLSHSETAAILDLEEGHIRILQYRALKKMRAIMLKD